MQYWIYGHKYDDTDEIAGMYDTYEEASENLYNLDDTKYEYADLYKTEWEQEPKYLATVVFAYDKGKVLTKR